MRFKTDMEALILGSLAEGPLHGYGIVKSIRESSSGLFSLPESKLYPLLHAMQGYGWISGEWQAPESGPARKAYWLLDAGKTELAGRREEWSKFRAAVEMMLSGCKTSTQNTRPGRAGYEGSVSKSCSFITRPGRPRHEGV